MTTQVSKPLTEAEQLFKDLAWDPLVKAEEIALAASSPLLGNPIMAAIDHEVIKLLSDYIFGRLTLFFDLTALNFIDSAHEAAWVNASQKLAVIAHDSGIDSPAFQKAREDAKAALSQFTHFNG